MDLFVARQPIFDVQRRVVAYEVLYRSSLQNSFDGTDDCEATFKVINATFLSAEGPGLLSGKPAFINIPEALLLDDTARCMPPAETVLELLETVRPTSDVLAACARLRSQSYKLAFDDFAEDEGCRERHPLAEVADYLKVDFRLNDRKKRLHIAQKYRKGENLLAEKVETEEEFRWAAQAGYSLFQGYFFAKPVVSTISEVSGYRFNYLQVLAMLRKPELDFQKLNAVLCREPALSYKILRLANSALFSRSGGTQKLDQALMRLGEQQLRKWLTILIMVDLAADQPSEILNNALLRAKLCETIAETGRLASRAGEMFMMGLFSRLDAIFFCSLPDLLKEISLEQDVRDALLDPQAERDGVSRLWLSVLHWEAGRWEDAARLLAECGVRKEDCFDLYDKSVKWVDSLYQIRS